jgi:hypothetical protein
VARRTAFAVGDDCGYGLGDDAGDDEGLADGLGELMLIVYTTSLLAMAMAMAWAMAMTMTLTMTVTSLVAMNQGNVSMSAEVRSRLIQRWRRRTSLSQ